MGNNWVIWGCFVYLDSVVDVNDVDIDGNGDGDGDDDGDDYKIFVTLN